MGRPKKKKRGAKKPAALTLLRGSDEQLEQTVEHFWQLAEAGGYDIDGLRMAFAAMALKTLSRTDIDPHAMRMCIAAISDTAKLMGVDTKPVTKRMELDEQGTEAIIDAINPRIEGLLEAIERGNEASTKRSRTRSPVTSYQPMQD